VYDQVKTYRYGQPKRNLNTIDPTLSFALSLMNPSMYVAPFVEGGLVLDTPVASAYGYASATVSAPTGANDSVCIVTLAPWAADRFSAGSPIGAHAPSSLAVVVTRAQVIGNISKNLVYGPVGGYANRHVSWASEMTIEVVAPLITLAGQIYIGSVQMSAWGAGLTANELIEQASTTHDVKNLSGRTFTLRAGIGHASGIHTNGPEVTLDGVNEEWISYAVLFNPVMDTTAAKKAYDVTMKIASNVIWIPDATQSALMGVAKGTGNMVSGAAPQRESMDKSNAALITRMNHFPQLPTNWSDIVSAALRGESLKGIITQELLATSLTGQGSQFNGGGSMLSGAPKRAVSDIPPGLTSHITDDAGFLTWERTRDSILHIDEWPPAIASLYDTYALLRDQMINALSTEVDAFEAYRQLQRTCQQKTTTTRGVVNYDYLLPDGKTLEWDTFYSEWESTFMDGLSPVRTEDRGDESEEDFACDNPRQEFEMEQEDPTINQFGYRETSNPKMARRTTSKSPKPESDQLDLLRKKALCLESNSVSETQSFKRLR